jgi:hypothetical protein
MHRLRVPCLLLHGAGDTRTEPDNTRRLAEIAESGDKTLAIYPGAPRGGRDGSRRALADDRVGGRVGGWVGGCVWVWVWVLVRVQV